MLCYQANSRFMLSCVRFSNQFIFYTNLLFYILANLGASKEMSSSGKSTPSYHASKENIMVNK